MSDMNPKMTLKDHKDPKRNFSPPHVAVVVTDESGQNALKKFDTGTASSGSIPGLMMVSADKKTAMAYFKRDNLMFLDNIKCYRFIWVLSNTTYSGVFLCHTSELDSAIGEVCEILPPGQPQSFFSKLNRDDFREIKLTNDEKVGLLKVAEMEEHDQITYITVSGFNPLLGVFKPTPPKQ